MKFWITLFLLVTVLAVSDSVAGTWTTQTSGTTSMLRHVQFVNAQTGYAVGSNGVFLKTTNGGDTWSHNDIWNGNLIIGCYFLNADTGWVGGDRGVMKTTNGGTSWTYQIGPDGVTKVYFVNALLGWAVGGADGSSKYGDIYKTTDGGSTWTHQHNESTWSRFYGVQFVDSTTGWAYTESNGLLIKTTDAGSTWQVQMSYGTSVAIRGMYFHDKNIGWVVGRTNTSGVAMKTLDGGAHWTDYGNGLQYALAGASFVDTSLGWAAGNSRSGVGALNTTDGGVTWNFTTAGNQEIGSIFFLDAGHGWIVGGNGMILKYSSTTGVADGQHGSVPGAYALSQNYPNPFNPSTTIQYRLESVSHVRLTLSNVLGQEVSTLVNGSQQPGEQSVRFDATGLPSGLYFYRLDATSVADPTNHFSQTRRMMLLK